MVTNQQYSEHPDGAPTDGAYYIGKVLQALNADPDVFNSTLVIIDFDENDGQFDHVPPPVPGAGTADEFYLEPSLDTGAAAGRPRLPGAADPRLAVDPRRLGHLRGLRPHLGAPVPGEVDRRDRQAGDLPEHQRLAAPRLRRPDQRARLRPPGLRPARPAVHHRHGRRGATPTTRSRRQRDARPGAGRQARPAAALPAEREPRRASPPPPAARSPPAWSLQQQRPARRAGPATSRSTTTRCTTAPAIASYPAAFPGQYTVAPSTRKATPSRRPRDPVRRRPATTSRSSARTASCAASPAT